MAKYSFVDWCYKTKSGRIFLKFLFATGSLKLGEAIVRSKISKPLVPWFIKRNKIDMSDFAGQKYETFQEFFSRTREDKMVDQEKSHLISPCDGYLSAYPIEENSKFFVKGSWYKISDLVKHPKAEKIYEGGQCVVLRLCADDYHHYCYIDDGFQKKNHYMEGELHSVQPVACESVPVYRLNRRMWTILHTENFGRVAQIAVGALLVGGIVNKRENCKVKRGKDMGHFELIGSTIVLLFEKDKISLLPEILQAIEGDREYRVSQGQQIGNRA